MLPPVAVHMTLPEAFNTIVVQTIITCECGWVIFTLLAALLRLDDLTIRNVHKHGLVLKTVSLAMHIFEALKAEIVLAISTKHLGLLHSTCGAQASTRRLEKSVVLPWTQRGLVQSISASLAEGHQALIAFNLRLHHTT